MTADPTSVGGVNHPHVKTSTPKSTLAQHTVLVADDSRTVLRLIERTLTAAGFGVVLADDGRKAVQLALETKPDLVVLDINMPELDGYGVCHELLANSEWNTKTPVIFLTSANAPHLAMLGNQLGAFLSKPTEPDLLLETVCGLLKSHAMA